MKTLVVMEMITLVVMVMMKMVMMVMVLVVMRMVVTDMQQGAGELGRANWYYNIQIFLEKNIQL